MGTLNKMEQERELHYQLTMCVASEMLEKGIITEDDYCKYETKMRAKYKPKIGDLFWDKPGENA